jgi:GT2 family glycosyltransferase
MNASAIATDASYVPAADPQARVSVVVATFRRLAPLSACLDGLELQTRPADEVLVVTHDDPQSRSYAVERAKSWPPVKVVDAARAGSVAAYNAGLCAATAPLVAFIDDDAVPAQDWLERIVATFARDPNIAAVGGRDLIMTEAESEKSRQVRRRPPEVGRIHRYGRMTGNHHVGTGPARDVDVLKGANMSFRRSVVSQYGFDDRLRGPGAIVHAELSVCLPLRKQGLRIVYDPEVLVKHYPAPRPAGDDRTGVDSNAAIDSAHNEALQILEFLMPRERLVFAAWSLLIGNTGSPGLAVLVRDLVRRKPGAWIRFFAAQRGCLAGWRTTRSCRASLGDAPDRDRSACGAQIQPLGPSQSEDGAISGV